MKEYLTIELFQILIAALVAGVTIGGIAHRAVEVYNRPKTFEENTYRATTYTGKGQFKCQTGCPKPQFVAKPGW